MTADTSLRENVIRDNLVCMQGVSVRFGKIVALDRVNLQVGRNEIVALIGDNGVGKSTLIKALIGCYAIEAGEICFDGRKVNFRSPREARLAGIETGYQDFALVDILSVSRNFFLGREHHRSVGPFKLLDHRKMGEVTRAQLEALGFQGRIDPHQSVSQLSGGERQMIAIARAIHFGAKLLILDEPTSALPESGIELVLGAVKKAKKAGLSVIFVTHKVGEIFQVADRFVVLQKGRNYADFRREDTNLRELERLFIHSRLTVMHEMAASIAHQVRNPLSVMKVSVEMLRDNFPAQGKKEISIRFTSPLDNTKPLFFSSPLILTQGRWNNSTGLSPQKWAHGDIRWIMRIGSIWEVIITLTSCALIRRRKSGRTSGDLGENRNPSSVKLLQEEMEKFGEGHFLRQSSFLLIPRQG